MRYARLILVVLSLVLTACTTQRQSKPLSPENPAVTVPHETSQLATPAQPPIVASATATPLHVPTTTLHESLTVSWAPFILSTTLTLQSSAEITGLSWSPDGTQLLYHIRDTTYVLDMDTQQSSALTIPSLASVWSPYGRQIGFINRDTHTFDIYDGAQGVVTQGTDIRVITEGIDWIDWLSDDTIVYATQKHFFIHGQRTANQPATVQVKSSFSSPLGTPDSSRPQVAWSPQGDDVISMDRSSKTTAFIHGTHVQKMLAAPYEIGLWSPDGALVVLTDRNHTLDVYDRAGNLRERASIGNNIRPLAWIGSERLIYTHNNAGSSPHNGYMFQRGSSEALVINEELPDATAIMEAVVSPPGTYLAYTTLNSSTFQLVIRVMITK